LQQYLESRDLSIEEIKAKLTGNIGRNIFFYDTVGSTNSVAAGFAEKGTAEGSVVLADCQETGKGRLGRKWVSPPGVNIYMSIILRPEIEPKHVTLITIMAAVACAIALRKVTGLNIAIKWPNDLTVSDKKIGGILTETKIEQDRIIFAIVGIGININIDINAFPEDVKKIATSAKNETGKQYSRTETITMILNEIDYWYGNLKSTGQKILLSQWQKLATTLGKTVKVTTGKETFTGSAESIDDEGMLILRLPSGVLKRISAGDLTILR
jgi:BirA family biotin operon repressor/biotin-[acetyl-CoA-carboxylase] ligase